MSDVALRGLRAENPMAFMAALGALSLVADGTDGMVSLSWLQGTDCAWTPVLRHSDLKTPEQVVEAILAGHGKRDLALELGWDSDLMRVSREDLREMLVRRLDGGDVRAAQMLAACLCELPARRAEGLVSYTPFRLIPRVGRARFLSTVRRECEAGADHLYDCLFERWRYQRGTQSLRWDPGASVSARATMAQAPTHVGPNGVPGSVLLAVRGMACFPLVTARGGRSAPAGMTQRDRFVWPVWDQPLSERATRMLLSLPWLYRLCELRERDREESHTPDRRRVRGIEDERDRAYRQLRAHTVVACYVARRVHRGKDDEALGWGEPIVVPT